MSHKEITVKVSYTDGGSNILLEQTKIRFDGDISHYDSRTTVWSELTKQQITQLKEVLEKHSKDMRPQEIAEIKREIRLLEELSLIRSNRMWDVNKRVAAYKASVNQ